MKWLVLWPHTAAPECASKRTIAAILDSTQCKPKFARTTASNLPHSMKLVHRYIRAFTCTEAQERRDYICYK